MLLTTTVTALLVCGLGCVFSAPTIQQKEETNATDLSITTMYTIISGENIRLSVTCSYSAPFLLEDNSGRVLTTLAIRRRPRFNEDESDQSGGKESDHSSGEPQQVQPTGPNLREMVFRTLDVEGDQSEDAQTQLVPSHDGDSDDDSFSELVAVNVGHKFGVAEDFNGSYEGQLDQEGKRALLTVHWESISWQELGDYKCVVTSVDYQGNCHHDTKTLDPKALAAPTVTGLRGSLKQCKSDANEAAVAAAATISKLEEEKAALKTLCYFEGSNLSTTPSVHLVCNDTSDKCESFVSSDATLCGELKDFSQRDCAYTCGRCDVHATPECSVPDIADATALGGKVSLLRGETVRYQCMGGLEAVSGDAIRICLASGELSGQDLRCGRRDCPSSWRYLPETKSCYRTFDDEMTYTRAEAICASHGAVLIMPKTASQHDFMKDFVGDTRTWLGLTDRKVEGTWIWADSTVLSGFTNWDFREPNNRLLSEHCVHTNGVKNEKGVEQIHKWNDYICDNDVTHAVICQGKLTCNVPTVANAKALEDKVLLMEGETVQYQCADGLAPMSGDARRVCLASGKLSGQDLQCVGGCEAGWTPFIKNGVKSCYKISEDKIKHNAGIEAGCMAMGAWGVIVESAEENEFIQRLNLMTTRVSNIWLDMTDTETEGTWVWNDGTEPIYTNWDKNQPDNWKDDENCAVFIGGGWWNDLSCSKHSLHYVCRKPAEEHP